MTDTVRMSPLEAKVREDLAAVYRLMAHFRMTDLIDTRISARVPGEPDHFLINRYSVLFDEMRPQDLVKIDQMVQNMNSRRQTMRRFLFSFSVSCRSSRPRRWPKKKSAFC